LIEIIPLMIDRQAINMYDNRPKKDWFSAVVTAALGAGAVTYFAISQGQHPLVALWITGFATVAALLIEEYLQRFSR